MALQMAPKGRWRENAPGGGHPKNCEKNEQLNTDPINTDGRSCVRLAKCFAAGGPRLSLSLHTPPPPPAPHATWPPLLHACLAIPPAALLCRHGDRLDQRVHLHHVGDDPPALGLALGSGLGSGAGVRFICILQVMGQPRAASQGPDANAR
eukprot:scaffold20441_cov63-Phaeocystis_antarctica.AAC.1